MRHHEWVEGESREDLQGETWWTCARCGARDSSMCMPWVEHYHAGVNRVTGGYAAKVSMQLTTHGGSPAWMGIESDCDLEIVARTMRG